MVVSQRLPQSSRSCQQVGYNALADLSAQANDAGYHRRHREKVGYDEE